jgi:hypothetical protein
MRKMKKRMSMTCEKKQSTHAGQEKASTEQQVQKAKKMKQMRESAIGQHGLPYQSAAWQAREQ